MDFEGEREQQVEARRISTETYGNDTVARKNFKTQWRWFHRNYDGDWAYFTSVGTLSVSYKYESTADTRYVEVPGTWFP